MTGAIGQLLSVKSRLKRNLVQRDQERKVQNGNVQMTNSTTLSGKPSLPATRYRSFKMFAAADRISFYASNLRSMRLSGSAIGCAKPAARKRRLVNPFLIELPGNADHLACKG